MKNKVANLLRSLANKIDSGTATPTEVKRYNNARRILANEADSGRWGKAFEMLNVSTKAHKTYVAAQGKADGYFYFNGERKAVEYKTNGGRIGNLYKLAKPENAFIVYSMDFKTRQTYRKDGTARPIKHYTVEPVILKVSDFLAILEHCNATKVIGHAGKGDDEVAIQGDSAKLAKCLADYPIPFDPDTRYTSDDFEELELWVGQGAEA